MGSSSTFSISAFTLTSATVLACASRYRTAMDQGDAAWQAGDLATAVVRYREACQACDPGDDACAKAQQASDPLRAQTTARAAAAGTLVVP